MRAEATGMWSYVSKAYFVAHNSKPEKFCFKALIFPSPSRVFTKAFKI